MDCWYPITIHKRKRFKDKESNITFEYSDGSFMQVPCGRCPACRRRKQNEWAFRCLEEVKVSKITAFVTLTYDDDHLPLSASGVPTLCPAHLTKLFKDLRYRIDSFRYFACGEYGDTFGRPHAHLLLFYNGLSSLKEIEDAFSECWFYGHIKFEPGITAGRAKYCAKYSMKNIGFDYGDVVPPFARMSRRPGIGKAFKDNKSLIAKMRRLDQWVVHDYQGTPYVLPRYYKEHLYSKDEIDTHSLLVEKLHFTRQDQELREFSLDNFGSFYQSTANQLRNKERLFIKHLKQENYGFKYAPKSQPTRMRWDASDFDGSDEF